MDEHKFNLEEVMALMKNDEPNDMTWAIAILAIMLALPNNAENSALAELKGRVDVIEKLVTK